MGLMLMLKSIVNLSKLYSRDLERYLFCSRPAAALEARRLKSTVCRGRLDTTAEFDDRQTVYIQIKRCF